MKRSVFQTKDVVPSAFVAKSGWQDLNLRPRAPETRALRWLSYTLKMAEGVGFEPTHGLLNRQVPYRLAIPQKSSKNG